MSFYHEDGHPTNVHRSQGFVHESGIVVCGQCAVEQAREFVTNGSWDATHSHALLTAAGYDPFDPESGDDWCSRCDADIVPRFPS